MKKIKLNGNEKNTSSETILDLINEIGLRPEITVVEYNKEVIKKDSYQQVKIGEGDQFEFVKMVGGG